MLLKNEAMASTLSRIAHAAKAKLDAARYNLDQIEKQHTMMRSTEKATRGAVKLMGSLANDEEYRKAIEIATLDIARAEGYLELVFEELEPALESIDLDKAASEIEGQRIIQEWQAQTNARLDEIMSTQSVDDLVSEAQAQARPRRRVRS